MMTIEQRTNDAVNSMEYAAGVAEQFIDPSHTGVVHTKKGEVKSLSAIFSLVSDRAVEISGDMEVEVSRILGEADAAVSRIAHFSEEVFVIGESYQIGRIYFVDAGIAYAPLLIPYVAGDSIAEDVAGGRLTVMQGLTVSDIGEGQDQLPTNRKIDLNVKYFEGLSDAVAAVTLEPLRYSRIITDSKRTKSECLADGFTYPDGQGDYYSVVDFNTVSDGVTLIDAGSRKLSQTVRSSYARPSLDSVIQKMSGGGVVKIVAVGDSITWGSNANNPGNQVARPWPSILQDHLQKWNSNDNITVVNYGFSGSDSGQIINNNLIDIRNENADLVILAVGVNDARSDRGIDVEQYSNNIIKISKNLHDSAIVYVSLTDVPTITGVTNGKQIGDYRNAMKRIAKEQSQVFLDIHSMMRKVISRRGEVRGKINRDKLHWSQEGYQLLADQIFMSGFANYDLEVDGNSFIDGLSQNFRGFEGLELSGSQYTVSRRISEGQQSVLFLYLDEVGSFNLVTHFNTRVRTSSAVSDSVTVDNTSTTVGSEQYDLSIPNTVSDSFAADVPIAVCGLRKGLNIITFSVASGQACSIQGFSLVSVRESGYMIPSDNEGISDKLSNGLSSDGFSINETGFSLISGRVSIAPGANARLRVSEKISTNIKGDTRIRIRGYFSDFTSILIGSKSLESSDVQNWVSDYGSAYSIHIRSLQTIVYHKNIVGNDTEIGQLDLGKGDRVLDIVTSSSGTSFFIDGVLIASMLVKLPEFYISITTGSGVGSTVIEYVSELGSLELPGADIPGETFNLLEENKLVMVGFDGLRRSVGYV
jgi:lysophospholipase L1-like esterase